MATTLGSSILDGDFGGGIVSIKSNVALKEAFLTPQPLYLLDADQTDVMDFGGTLKTITLNGVYIAPDVATLKVWVDEVEALINGHQDVSSGYPITLSDPMRGTILVKVLSVETPFNEAEPTKVDWVIKLMQSSTNA